MRLISTFIISTILIFQLFAAGLSLADELIPPTRTLGEGEKTWGRLTVFSEPPGLDVILDDKDIGVTPVWLNRVETGIHTMRIKDKEAEIYIEAGKKMKVGLFKESLISMEEKEPAPPPQPGLTKKAEPRGQGKAQPPKEEREKELTRWDLFVNGSLPFF